MGAAALAMQGAMVFAVGNKEKTLALSKIRQPRAILYRTKPAFGIYKPPQITIQT